jgi:hydroxyethylthiazole kinase
MTNFVVMNDCANITLHIGGSPVMAHAPEEVEEMVTLADSLVLNIGTLTGELIDSMVLAGQRANRKGIPVLLDPVGAGATVMRTEAARRLLEEIRVSFIKGNAGEISVLAGEEAVVRGVDSAGTAGNLPAVAQKLAKEYDCTVIITGAVDWVSDGHNTYSVHNGHSLMGAITGTGCMSGSLVGAFAGAVGDPVLAALSGLVCFGVAGELAAEKELKPASFKRALFDEVYALTAEKAAKLARLG